MHCPVYPITHIILDSAILKPHLLFTKLNSL